MNLDELFHQKEMGNEEGSLDILNSAMKSVGDSLTKIARQVPEAFLNPIVNKELQATLNAVNKLKERSGINLAQSASTKEENEVAASWESERQRLKASLERERNELRKAREEIEQLKNQILNESTFCASLGAVLGNLMWCASKYPQVIDAWLLKGKVRAFLSMANGTLIAFINTYDEEFPAASNVEYEFVMGLLGIATNISASPAGRRFFVRRHEDGGNLVESIIESMPRMISSASSHGILRLMLMILYNVSMDKNGLRRLLELKVASILSDCLKANAAPTRLHAELQVLYLRILRSIAHDLDAANSERGRDDTTNPTNPTNPSTTAVAASSTPLDVIERIAASSQDEAKDLARDTLERLANPSKNA